MARPRLLTREDCSCCRFSQPSLLRLAAGKGPDEALFTGRARRTRSTVENLENPRHWLAGTWKQICDIAGVPVVGAHGLRGTHTSLSVEVGQTGQAVATAFGHTSTSMTPAATT